MGGCRRPTTGSSPAGWTPRTDGVADNYTLRLRVPADTVASAVGNKPNEEAMLEVRVATPGGTLEIGSLNLSASPGSGSVRLSWKPAVG